MPGPVRRDVEGGGEDERREAGHAVGEEFVITRCCGFHAAETGKFKAE